jgi:hypothetical protein
MSGSRESIRARRRDTNDGCLARRRLTFGAGKTMRSAPSDALLLELSVPACSPGGWSVALLDGSLQRPGVGFAL